MRADVQRVDAMAMRYGSFRSDTRTTRLERLHGPKPARKRAPELPPEEQEKLRHDAVEERERYRQEREDRR